MLLLNKIKVENANALNGIIHGIPAITGFLGFVHALQRNTGINMDGAAIIFHKYELHKGTPSRNVIYENTKNKINEHIVNAAYIDFTVSLLIDCDIEDKTLLKAIKKKINTMRIAGGDIVNIKEVTIEDNSNKIKEKLGGGFILFDKNNDINKYEGKDNLDKMITACNAADYIPLAVGFRALTECSNSIKNVRDNDTPSTFVEQLYGLGKFENIRNIDSFNDLFWRYKYKDKMYICTQFLKDAFE